MSRFHQIETYRSSSRKYQLLPFRFTALDHQRYAATNLAGEFIVLSREVISALISHELSDTDPNYVELRARHFLVDDATGIAPDLLAIKVRSRYERLADFTG